MTDETHKLQKDPPEGSRKVIEHELERQAGREKGSPGKEKARDEAGSASSETQDKPARTGSR